MASTSQAPRPHLYAGETLDTIAGFPTIYHYQPAKESSTASGSGAGTRPGSGLGPDATPPKPLIVCVTGGLHLARVFYGGHAGSRREDFVAHWLSEQGFGVLSLSYPVETATATMPVTTATAGFRVGDWGVQAATTTRKVMDEQALGTNSVVLVSWSMGGRMVVPFNVAARDRGLHVALYVSLAATPGFSSIRPLPPGMTCSAAGYFHVLPQLDVFYAQIAEMQALNGGRQIVPRDTYLREYVGGSPVNLIGLRLRFDGEAGAFVQDGVTHEEDSRVLDVANFPLIAAVCPSSILDASHALADRATWGFLLTYKLETMIGARGLSSVRGTPRWPQLLDLVHSAPARLSVSVPGNHFFFLGEESARGTAAKVVGLWNEALAFRRELADLTGVEE